MHLVITYTKRFSTHHCVLFVCCFGAFLKTSAGPVIGAKEGGVAGFFKGGLGGIVAGI
jgi:hypothetical protein